MFRMSKALLVHALFIVGGVLSALAASGALTAKTHRFFGPPPLDGYVAESDGYTTVYAPSKAAALEGHQDVRYARARFYALFGTNASPLAVVMVDNPDHFQQIDLPSLRPPGGRVLPFLTQARLSTSPISVATGQARDSEVPVKVLAHEACHAYVGVLAGDAVTRPPLRMHSNKGLLPDWFDESIATLCESAEARGARRRYFRNHLDHHVPLGVFVRMQHPLGGLQDLEALGIDFTPRQAAVHVLTADRIKQVLPNANHAMFYAQALSLGEFLKARGGTRGLQSLASTLAKGRTLDQALVVARSTAPGLPATVQALEAEWMRWVIGHAPE
jgi:hypothetical protein